MRWPRIIFGALAPVLWAVDASAQSTATLILTVTSAETASPITDATVRFPSLGLGAITDAEGAAHITGIPAPGWPGWDSTTASGSASARSSSGRRSSTERSDP